MASPFPKYSAWQCLYQDYKAGGGGYQGKDGSRETNQARKDRKMRKNLKEARQKAGMTQKQMADSLGIHERYYKSVESGERLGSIQIWDMLEDILGANQRFLREIHPDTKGNP